MKTKKAFEPRFAVTALALASMFGGMDGGIFRKRHVQFDPEENSGGADDEAAKATADKAAADKIAAERAELNKPRFSQAEMAKAVTEERRKEQEKSKKDVEAALRNRDLTKAERDELEIRKKELEEALMSEKERSKLDREQLEKKYQKDLESKDKEKEEWKGRFATSSREREITDAAVHFGAKNTEQIRDMISHKVQLVQAKDDKLNPIDGQYENRIELAVKDEKGKVSKQLVTIQEFVEAMSKSEQHGNLFTSSRLGGTGSRGGASGAANGNRSSNDPAHVKIARGIRNLK